MDKKIGLEHTIRNLLSESIGSGITTDKYTKTANSFFKPFHVEPKKGDTHPDGASVRAARNVQKERTSETMKEEEQLDEFLKPLSVVALKYGDEALDLLGKTLKTADDAPVPKKVPVKKPSEKLPFKEPEKPSMPSLPPEAPPSNLPVPVKPTAPAAPKAPAPAAPTPAAPKQTPVTTPSAPKQKPVIKTDTKVSNKTKATIATGAAVATAVATKLKDFFKGKSGGAGTGAGTGGAGGGGGIPAGITPGQPVGVGSASTFGVSHYKHMADPRRSGFDEETRQEIVIVGRPNNDRKKPTKQAEIIRKIIDEQKAEKKKKSSSTVDLHPKLKDQEMDQN